MSQWTKIWGVIKWFRSDILVLALLHLCLYYSIARGFFSVKEDNVKGFVSVCDNPTAMKIMILPLFWWDSSCNEEYVPYK